MRILFKIIALILLVTPAFAYEGDNARQVICELTSDVVWRVTASETKPAGLTDSTEEQKNERGEIYVSFFDDLLTYSYPKNSYPNVFRLTYRDESQTRGIGTRELIFKSKEWWSDPSNEMSLRFTNPFCDDEDEASQIIRTFANEDFFSHRIFNCPCE